jgi:adenosine deaminase
MDLRALPKVDLHRHLEGALRLQTIIDLYREAGDPLPETSPEELAPRAQVLEPMGSLERSLDVLELVRVVQTYE